MIENRYTLFVEDSPDDQTPVLRKFKQYDPATPVVLVESGEAALELIFGSKTPPGGGVLYPTIILLNINLPKMNGFDVLKKIKARSELKNVPIIVLTDLTDQINLEKCYDLGTNSVINKSSNYGEYYSDISAVYRYWIEINKNPSSLSRQGNLNRFMKRQALIDILGLASLAAKELELKSVLECSELAIHLTENKLRA